MSVSDEENGFLDRWAKRKQAVADEADAAIANTEPEDSGIEPQTDEQALELLREKDPELADQIAAIDIDKLTYDDDFSVFMNKKVPEFLRRKALSKLWLSSPVLANLDGLNEYDEDFRDASTIVEAVQTAVDGAKQKMQNARGEDCPLEAAAEPDLSEGTHCKPDQIEGPIEEENFSADEKIEKQPEERST